MLLIVAALAAAANPPPTLTPVPANCRDGRGRISLRCLPRGTAVTGPLPVTLEPAAPPPPLPARRCRDRRRGIVACRREG